MPTIPLFKQCSKCGNEYPATEKYFRKWHTSCRICERSAASDFYSKANRDKRRARILNAPGTYTADDVKRQYAEQEGRCAYCGISIYMDIPKDVHVDHVMPLSRGGSNGPDNLLLTCQPCNQSKGSKSVVEWVTVRGW